MKHTLPTLSTLVARSTGSSRSTRSARQFGPLMAAALAVGALSLTGCSAIDQFVSENLPRPAETRDAGSGEIVGGGKTDVFTLRVGDCLSDAKLSDTVSDVPTVPCADAHDSEVYADFTLPEGDYPADASDLADQGCYDRFPEFAGIAYEDSTLDFSNYIPTEDGWRELNDRTVTCVIYDVGQVQGTLKGAAR